MLCKTIIRRDFESRYESRKRRSSARRKKYYLTTACRQSSSRYKIVTGGVKYRHALLLYAFAVSQYVYDLRRPRFFDTAE